MALDGYHIIFFLLNIFCNRVFQSVQDQQCGMKYLYALCKTHLNTQSLLLDEKEWQGHCVCVTQKNVM